jgi:general secretion pathway protein D
MNITAPTTRMMAYEQTNTLIITDTAANIKKLTDLISLLDIEGFDEGLEVVKIKYASAEDIAKLVDQLLPGPGGGGAPGGPPGVPRFGGKGFASRKTKEGGVISHIIADGRTNSLIISANSKGFEQVKALIHKLDTRVSLSQGGSRIHVMYLQFADAEQVANTMNNLASGAQTGGSKPGMPGVPPAQAALFEGAVKVAADKPTNSLVVTASATDFMLVKRVIGKLDVPRDQVYVEAAIMEMNMTKAFSMSSSVVSPKNGLGFLPNSDLANFLTNPLTGVQGLALGFNNGSTMQFTPPGSSTPISISTIQGLITALQQNSNSNVLATPQILTLDNQEASIEIGESVPVPTVTAVQGAGTAQSFTREKVSLSLTIKPQINKISDFVKLEIKQKFQDFENRSVPRALQDQAFGTTERSSQTVVVVQNNDTVALGGLMRDKVNESTTKVPLLGDIPVLGWLFRASSKTTVKTNLIVFITPKIIKQYQNIRGILDKKLQERDEFIETANGGNDPYERQKLDMIRNLPSLSELKNTYKVENADALDEEHEEEEEQPVDGGTPSAYRQNQGGVALPPSLQGLPPTGGVNTAYGTAPAGPTAQPSYPGESAPTPAPEPVAPLQAAPANPGVAPQQ